jgi:hypothetical protein
VSLKRGQVISPQSASLTAHRAILLAPEEDAVTSKTMEFDESVLLDWPELWGLGRLLLQQCRRQGSLQQKDEKDALWGFDHKEYNKLFARASELAEVNTLQPHPYCLRHGGASHDSLMRRRSIEGIQKRGRWRAPSSATRYDKHARVLKEVSKLGKRARTYGEYVFKNLNTLLAGTRQVIAPPAIQRSSLGGLDVKSAPGKRARSASAATPTGPATTSLTSKSRKRSKPSSARP